MYFSTQASPQQLRQVQQAQRTRQGIVKSLSHRQVSRRDLFKRGLFTAGGGLALKNGLKPFVGNAYGKVPTGVPRSLLLGAAALFLFAARVPQAETPLKFVSLKPVLVPGPLQAGSGLGKQHAAQVISCRDGHSTLGNNAGRCLHRRRTPSIAVFWRAIN